MISMYGNNVVWLCAKYAVDANLFRLECPIRKNVGREVPWGELPVGGSNRRGNARERIVHGKKYPGGKAPG